MVIMDASTASYTVCIYLIPCLLRSSFVSSQTVCTDIPVSDADQHSPSRGENLSLSCTVGTMLSSLPNITWYYQNDTNSMVAVIDASVDERLVVMVDELSEECFNHVLYISSVEVQDSGRYWCSNGVNISDPITIDVMIPFNFSYPICSANGEQHILAEAGEVIELSCEAQESNPPWLLQWQKTLTGSTASVEGTIDFHEGIKVLTASVTVSAAQYHGSVLSCFAYCPYFPDSHQCGGYVQSSCKLDNFYVTDVPLNDTFHIAPVDQSVTEGSSITFFCTTRALESGGPTVGFIFNKNRSVEQVSIPNGYALVLSDITYSDNETTIGCGLFFKGKRYRVKYSTVYVIRPITMTVGSSYTTLIFNATDTASDFMNVTDMVPNNTHTGFTTFGNGTLWDSTTEPTAQSNVQTSSTLNQTVDDIPLSSSSSSSPTIYPSKQDSTFTTETNFSVFNVSNTADNPTPDTNASTITPHHEPNQGPSSVLIGLIIGCSVAALLLVIVLLVVGKTIAKRTMGHQSSWSPQHNSKRTYWDYRDEKKPFRMSILSGRTVGHEGSYDLDEARLEKL